MQPEDLIRQLSELPNPTRRSVLARVGEPRLETVMTQVGDLDEARFDADQLDQILATGGGGLGGGLWSRLATELAQEPGSEEALVGETIGQVRIDSVLGRGGMGAVYRGFDTWLERPVAVKTLRGHMVSDEEALVRFRREARLLSRLDHPHICRVYGLLRHAERDFLVLELIDGTPLAETAVGELATETRLRIARDIAEALIAAHREQIVHRDLKPGNVMITPEGRAKVLDFGISRSIDAADDSAGDGDSEPGALVGTLAYMSPEQARGEPLTPKSDLYAFGLLIQELYTGQRVYPDSLSAIELLGMAQRGEHQGTEQLEPQLADLVEQLLHPEPEQRLDAQAASAALARIAGQPRRRRARRRMLIGGSVAALLAVFLTIALVRSRARLEQQADLAQRISQEVKDLETRMRSAYLLPPHDIGQEKKAVRQRLEELELTIRDAGSLAFGPGHLALGQGYMAVGEDQRARQVLEAAWERDYRPPELAYAYGLSLGRLLQRDRGAWNPARNPEQNRARRQSLEERAQEVASLLRAGAGSRHRETSTSVVPEYPEALLAFYEERLEEALALSRKAADQASWLYQASLLEGDVLKRMGELSRDRGDYEVSQQHFLAADRAYAAAQTVGESDPSVYEARCDLAARRMQLLLYGLGSELEGEAEQAAEVCQQAIAIDATRASSYTVLAVVYDRWAEAELEAAGGQEQILAQAIAAARKAVELEPDFELAYSTLGSILYRTARQQARQGEDALPTMQQAIAACRRAVELGPTQAENHNRLGIALRIHATELQNRGEDPRSGFAAAADSYRRGIELEPESTYLYNNLGRLQVSIARAEGRLGLDPRPALQEAIAALQQSIELNPKNPYALNNLGDAWIALATAQADRGVDPEPALETAAKHFQQTLEVQPSYAAALNNLGLSMWHRGRWKVLYGEDPSALLGPAREALQQATVRAPGAFQPLVNLGRLQWLEAEHSFETGGDPRPLVERALIHYHQALDKNPRYVTGRTEAATALLLAARWSLAQDQDPRPWLDQARELAQEAQHSNGSESTVLHLLGRLEMLEGLAMIGGGDSPETAFRQASEHLQGAVENPGATAERLATLGQLHRHRARWLLESSGEDHRPEAQTGLERCEEALAKHPGHPRAAQEHRLLSTLLSG